jgi:ankyrin repeat protein
MATRPKPIPEFQALGQAQREANGRALNMAAYKGDVAKVKRLLPVSDPLWRDEAGMTALHAASVFPKSGILKLLAPASDCDALNDFGKTPLMVASCKLEAVQIMLPFADPAIRGARGMTALHYAASEGAIACAKALFPRSDPRAINEDGLTAAALAKSKGHSACAEELVAMAEKREISELVAIPKPRGVAKAHRL